MRQGLTIILSAATGLLIALPGAFTLSPLIGVPFIVMLTVAGGYIGYKRRTSDSFFYFTLVCSVVLLSMLTQASFKAQQEEGPNLTDKVVN